MDTRIDEIADGIYRISTFVELANLTFNQFLIDADEPLLFHTGQRHLFPSVSEALARVRPVESLRWVGWGHLESDESGAMNEWLAAAPHAEVAVGFLAGVVSVADLADRPPRMLGDDEVIDLGKRFLPKDPGSAVSIDANEGFERFTERSRNVIMRAHDAARAAAHDEIVPAHLVLGLLSEPEGIGARAIEHLGVSLDSVRDAAAATLPVAVEEPPELVPYGTGAKKVLELSIREALRLGHNYVGTEHLLLALLEAEAGDRDAPGGGVLTSLGVEKTAVEEYVVTVLDSLA